MNKYSQYSNKNRLKKEVKQYRMCGKKRRYESEQEAYQLGQVIYKCKYCNGYHRSGKLASLVADCRKVENGL